MNKLLLLVSCLVLTAVPSRAADDSWASMDEAARIVKMRARLPPFLAMGENEDGPGTGNVEKAAASMSRACRDASSDYAPSGRSYQAFNSYGFVLMIQLCAPTARTGGLAYELLIGKDPRHDELVAYEDWRTQCKVKKGALIGDPKIAWSEKGMLYFGICEYKPE